MSSSVCARCTKNCSICAASAGGSVRCTGAGCGARAEHRQAHFISHHLHGLRQVERAEIVHAGNPHHARGNAPAPRFPVRCARCRTPAPPARRAPLLPALAERPRAVTISGRFTPRRRADRPSAKLVPASAAIMSRWTPGAGQHVVRTRRQRVRLRIGKARRLHQFQPRETHRADRPRGAADVARVRGAHQHEADTGRRGRGDRSWAAA